MSRELDSLARGPLAMAAALALSLAVLWALLSQGITQHLVPPPENVGQSFFTSLKAHNYQAAHDELSVDLRQQVDAETLKQLNERLEAAGLSIDRASGESSHIQGTAATADIRVMLANGTEHSLTMPFTQDQGLWYIASLAPLEALVGAP